LPDNKRAAQENYCRKRSARSW